MGVLARVLRALAPERRDAGGGLTVGLGAMSGGSMASPRLAENVATVTACVGAIASTLATLPARVYRTAPAGRVELSSHPVARLIRNGPNPRQTWPDWAEWTLAQALLWGNSLSLIEYDGAGRITGLLPVPWCNVLVSLLPNGSLAYDVSAYVAPWGGTGEPRRYLEGEVFHLRDRSDDGYLGRSRLSRAPEVLEAALGIQTYSAAIWRNGATPSGAIVHPGRLSVEGKSFLAQEFNQMHAGAANAKKLAILDEGMTWTPFSVSPEDAEVLESRRFTVEEITRLYQIPPPIVQDYTHGSFTNTAQAALWFAQLTLTPWARKIEAEFARSVFGPESDCHLELDLSGLMRGDFAARWASYGPAIEAGILAVNEVREIEGFNPRPDPAELVPGSSADQ